MKKRLKSEVVRPVNSAQMHYSWENSQKLRLLFMNSAWTIAVTNQVPLKRGLKKKKKE